MNTTSGPPKVTLRKLFAKIERTADDCPHNASVVAHQGICRCLRFGRFSGGARDCSFFAECDGVIGKMNALVNVLADKMKEGRRDFCVSADIWIKHVADLPATASSTVPMNKSIFLYPLTSIHRIVNLRSTPVKLKVVYPRPTDEHHIHNSINLY